jgi:hypothetical protein
VARWTDAEFLMKGFTPAPWKTIGCEIDLRPGGIFATVMQSTEGQAFPNAGCYLEVAPTRRPVWTSALAPGYRPGAERCTPRQSCPGIGKAPTSTRRWVSIQAGVRRSISWWPR